MSLNSHLELTPSQGEFTLESLGLTTDPIGAEGVLDMKPENAPTAVIQSDMHTPGPHDTSLDSKEIAEIPSWNNRVCIMTDTADKIVDMVEIQKDIEGAGVMSAEKSHVIEATFENFYSPLMSLRTFSQQETRINYQASCDFMKKRLKATMEALVTQFREVNTTGMQEMTKDVLEAREYCADELRDIVNDSVNKVVAIKPIVSQGPVILPFIGDKFIDMLSVDLASIDLDQIKSGVPLTDEFRKSFDDMKKAWSDKSLKDCIAEILNSVDSEYPPNQATVVHNVFDGLTASLIVAVVGREAYRQFYEKSIEMSESAKSDLETQMREINEALENGENIHSLISPRADKLSHLAKQVVKVKADAVNFGLFFQSTAAVLLYLISLR